MSQTTYIQFVIILSVGGFFLGSVLFAKWLPRAICGIDIEAVSEDGNPGTANVFKHCGVPVGILTGICELGKAFAPIEIANIFIPIEMRTPLYGLIICSAVLGHIFSVYNRGNGGMGVAAFWGALMGVFLQCQLIFFLVGIYIVVRYIVKVRQQHLRTFVCFAVFLAVVAVFSTNMIYKPAFIFLSAVICVKSLCMMARERNAGDAVRQANS